MDRNGHRKYFPYCPPNIPVVDQYLWKQPDNKYAHANCLNGISQPIYNCHGEISRALPLHMYPKVDEIHPEIITMLKSGKCFPYHKRFENADERLEGFYNGPQLFLQSNVTEPGKLPSPSYICNP